MDDFDEVGSRLRRINVTAPDYGNAHGVMSLDATESVIELTGDLPLDNIPPPGWFNLRLNEAGGKTFYIHNALRMSMTMPADPSNRTVQIYPNLVVDNALALDDRGRCQRIRFRLDGWDACFSYNYFETLNVPSDPPEDLVDALQSARYDFAQDEPFAPEAVFVANNLGTIVDFEVDGRHYSIFAGMRLAHGNRTRLNSELRLIGTITFPEPVDLDTATNACWDWRRYFNQLSMGTLPFLGMTVAASNDPMSPMGNLYLPNNKDELPRSIRRADAYYMPLNRWVEREKAGEAMRVWMGRNEERRFFRAALDRVLARPGHVDIEDAVTLCAGIDTLTALASTETLPKSVLDAMTQAAESAASENDVHLDSNRIRGLLGSLKNDDLRRRLRRLAAKAAPEAEQTAVEQWIEIIVSLRLFGAHGRAPAATDHDLIAGPAVDALAALCVRYDLQDAGVPDRCANNARSRSRMEWDQAIYAIEQQRRMTPS